MYASLSIDIDITKKNTLIPIHLHGKIAKSLLVLENKLSAISFRRQEGESNVYLYSELCYHDRSTEQVRQNPELELCFFYEGFNRSSFYSP